MPKCFDSSCLPQSLDRNEIANASIFFSFFNPLPVFTFLIESINYSRNIPVIAVSETLAKQIVRFYPSTRGRIKVINNGVKKREENTSNPLPRLFDNSDFVISFASNDHKKRGLSRFWGRLISQRKVAEIRGC